MENGVKCGVRRVLNIPHSTFAQESEPVWTSFCIVRVLLIHLALLNRFALLRFLRKVKTCGAVAVLVILIWPDNYFILKIEQKIDFHKTNVVIKYYQWCEPGVIYIRIWAYNCILYLCFSASSSFLISTLNHFISAALQVVLSKLPGSTTCLQWIHVYFPISVSISVDGIFFITRRKLFNLIRIILYYFSFKICRLCAYAYIMVRMEMDLSSIKCTSLTWHIIIITY